AMDAVEIDAAPLSLGGIAGRGERAQRHAVKAVGEGDDRTTPRNLAGEFQRRFHRIGAGGTGEHQLVIHAARLEDDVLIGGKKGLLGLGVHVEAMGDAVLGDVFDKRSLHVGVVVAVIERGAAGEEIDIGAAGVVMDRRALGLAEAFGEAARIGPHLAFAAFENLVRHHISQSFLVVLVHRPLRAGRIRHERKAHGQAAERTGSASRAKGPMVTRNSVSCRPAKWVSRLKWGWRVRSVSSVSAMAPNSAQEGLLPLVMVDCTLVTALHTSRARTAAISRLARPLPRAF